MNTKQNSDKREKALRIGSVVRSFSVGDWVVWKLSENCSKNNISKKGKVIEVLGDGFYIVTFGYQSIYGTRTGKYFWTHLWLA
jgi:hypothetical protein